MKRIIIHWTAGVYNPNQTDFEHYHYLVTGDGLVIKGKYEPKDIVKTANMHSTQAAAIQAQSELLCAECMYRKIHRYR